MLEVHVKMPAGALGASVGEHPVTTAMRIIGVGFGKDDDWCAKYGANVETDVFAMRRFYEDGVECDCGFRNLADKWHAANEHAPNCYQTDMRERMISRGSHWSQSDIGWKERAAANKKIYKALARKYGTDAVDGADAHCTCYWSKAADQFFAANRHAPTCASIQPNFLYKPTGFALDWYKYIGREMSVKNDAELPPDWLDRIFASHPSGMTAEQAAEKTAEMEGETRARFAAMLSSAGFTHSLSNPQPQGV